MSVFRKKRTNGSLSENWYYEFKIGEQRYRGSTFRSSKKAANDFENNLKFELRSLVKNNTVDNGVSSTPACIAKKCTHKFMAHHFQVSNFMR